MSQFWQHTVDCFFTDSYRELINEQAIFFIISHTFEFWVLIFHTTCFKASETSLSDLEQKAAIYNGARLCTG